MTEGVSEQGAEKIIFVAKRWEVKGGGQKLFNEELRQTTLG
jgi:hypothetical protein